MRFRIVFSGAMLVGVCGGRYRIGRYASYR